MYATRKRLGELLLSHNLITPQQLDHALRLQKEHFQKLGQILIQQGYVSEERVLQACAVQKGVNAWHLQHDAPAADAVALLNAEMCRTYQVLPVQIQAGKLILAMREPADVDVLDMVRNLTKMRVEPVLAVEERLQQAIETAYHGVQTNRAEVTRFVTMAMGEAQNAQAEVVGEGVVSEAEMRPVVGLVNQVLRDAVAMRASDIHIEPRRNRVEIRARVDGQLVRIHEIPSTLQAALIARIKIMATLDVVEYRLPQDGRLPFTVDGRSVDMRVSVLPNHYGQRIVLRILDKSVALRQLGELGFATHNLRLFQDMIHKPHGIVLVTGPTGSGKTTTLYAAINHLKTVANNIMTCEDPIEYELDGINQSHVNEKVGLTFAAQLRAVLRQDPDIVLVGEIRDHETAETAIRAALTGHLVLSTLHCNDAPSAIARLTDMGIDPSLLSTALIGTTAQRLVRVLCPQCRQQATPTPDERALFRSVLDVEVASLWRPGGCPACGQTGYKGRAGVHEVFPTPHTLQKAIAERASVEALREQAVPFGYRSMQHDACERVIAGQTSLAEIQRLVYLETAVAPVVSSLESVLRAA